MVVVVARVRLAPSWGLPGWPWASREVGTQPVLVMDFNSIITTFKATGGSRGATKGCTQSPAAQ